MNDQSLKFANAETPARLGHVHLHVRSLERSIVAEFFGGLGLITGLLGRIAALGVGATMLVGALMSHVQHGFFMNWGGQLPAGQEGFEFHILAVALAAIVILRGSGAWSIDRLLTSRLAD